MPKKRTSTKKSTPKVPAKKTAKLTPATPVSVPVISSKPASKPSKPRGKTAARSSAPAVALTHEQIAARAYAVWLAKGQPQGQDEQNWRDAEAELKRELGLA
jgi:hypothetical protein